MQAENTRAEEIIYNEELVPHTNHLLIMEHDNQDS